MLSEKLESLKSYLEDERNFMELVELIEEIFWETGSLEWLKVHNMDEFDNIYCEYEKNEIAELIENSSRTFTISDDLFRHDIYDGLISYSWDEYKNEVYDSMNYIMDSIENLKKYDICKLEIIAENMKYCDKNIMRMLQDIINDEKEEQKYSSEIFKIYLTLDKQ